MRGAEIGHVAWGGKKRQKTRSRNLAGMHQGLGRDVVRVGGSFHGSQLYMQASVKKKGEVSWIGTGIARIVKRGCGVPFR